MVSEAHATSFLANFQHASGILNGVGYGPCTWILCQHLVGPEQDEWWVTVTLAADPCARFRLSVWPGALALNNGPLPKRGDVARGPWMSKKALILLVSVMAVIHVSRDRRPVQVAKLGLLTASLPL